MLTKPLIVDASIVRAELAPPVLLLCGPATIRLQGGAPACMEGAKY